jgi:processive rubber oxygenase RoxA-like protein
MRKVADGIGTAPYGVRLSPDGQSVYVANYLSRNVVRVASAQPIDPGSGKPDNLRCIFGAFDTRCATNNDCPSTSGFCNHPGGQACSTDSDCTTTPPPCIRNAECVPLILSQPVPSIRGKCSVTTATRCSVNADCPGGETCLDLTGDPSVDPVPPGVLDGKILFNTAARDASVPNGVGLSTAAPRYNDPNENGRVPGSVVSTSHDASYVTCSTCHADFGGQDGRTWDFSQFGASLRNTMDLRGRPGFAPGTCSNDAGKQCFFDAACEPGGFCKANPAMIPPNVQAADRDRYFNPMLTVHWNGDRDEVEDFEHTFRSLMGAGDCDSVEDVSTCEGALIQRSPETSTDPADVNADLGAPNRNITANGKNVGVRLTHMADFVYSLTDFVKNPNQPTAASERGRKVFNDPQTQCTSCHLGGPGGGQQFFTDKKPNPSFDPGQAGAADHNNPFIRHDVGTMNFFDKESPLTIAQMDQVFQNPRVPIPGDRGPLGDYITPVLNDAWNTAPYLHDGSAHTLLDVVRPCDPTVDDCLHAGRGRNIGGQHGVTSILTPQQLNDLVAFQKTLTLGTIVGTNERVLAPGALDVTRAIVKFGKQRKKHTAKGSFVLAGRLRGAPGAIDPAHDGVTFTIATPQSDALAIVSRKITMKGGGRRLIGRSTEGGGTIAVILVRSGGGYRFTAAGHGLDLSALAADHGDPKSRDLTVAFEVSGATFVRNRNLAAKKATFRIPRKRA